MLDFRSVNLKSANKIFIFFGNYIKLENNSL